MQIGSSWIGIRTETCGICFLPWSAPTPSWNGNAPGRRLDHTAIKLHPLHGWRLRVFPYSTYTTLHVPQLPDRLSPGTYCDSKHRLRPCRDSNVLSTASAGLSQHRSPKHHHHLSTSLPPHPPRAHFLICICTEQVFFGCCYMQMCLFNSVIWQCDDMACLLNVNVPTWFPILIHLLFIITIGAFIFT